MSKFFSGGTRVARIDIGYMVMSPSLETASRLRDAGVPITSRRLAIIETGHYLPDGAAKAYADLFAAAPDLLEVLKLVRSYGCPGTTDDGIDIPYLADKAIAKATGT